MDTHIHLDKVLIRDQLAEHDGTLRGAIDAIHAAKRAYTVEDVRRRATAVIEASVLTGTTRLRSHVDVDTVGGLVPLDGVLAAARDCADIAEVQVIAFPQEGLLRDPGAADLMAEAMQRGATVVGGMPHWEATEDAQREHVRLCFELAARHDADVDMHVDETDDGSVRTLAMVVAETERRGWQHRVTVGHVCCAGRGRPRLRRARHRRLRPARHHRRRQPRDEPGHPGPRRPRAGAARHHPGPRADGRRCAGRLRPGLRAGRLLPRSAAATCSRSR